MLKKFSLKFHGLSYNFVCTVIITMSNKETANHTQKLMQTGNIFQTLKHGYALV